MSNSMLLANQGQTALIIAFSAIAFLILIILISSIKIVRQSTAVIVERFGKFHKILETGIRFIVPFIDNMKRLFKKVDVMVSRAGATTISEIISYKVPTILIPSPYVTDNHQYKNAMSLVDKMAAILIEEKELDSDLLIQKVDEIINDKDEINSLKSNLSKMYVQNSASKIYELIVDIVNG